MYRWSNFNKTRSKNQFMLILTRLIFELILLKINNFICKLISESHTMVLFCTDEIYQNDCLNFASDPLKQVFQKSAKFENYFYRESTRY